MSCCVLKWGSGTKVQAARTLIIYLLYIVDAFHILSIDVTNLRSSLLTFSFPEDGQHLGTCIHEI